MKILLTFPILLFLISGGSPDNTFTINLDLPPKERFREVNAFYKPQLLGFIDQFKGNFIFEVVVFLLDKIPVGEMLKVWTEEEKGEIEGLSEDIGGYLQFLYIAQLIGDFWGAIRNFWGYEKALQQGCYNQTEEFIWPNWCTSMVANQPSGVIHARNFDLGPQFIGLLYRAQFTQGDELIFKADMVAGLVGVVTGMKNGIFGVTVDTRSPYVKSRYDILPILETLVRLQKSGYRTQTMLVRETLTKAKSYVDALDMLSNTNLVSDVYYTVSGVKRGEGAILSRDPVGCAHITYLGEERFIIVTNYDYWNNDHRADSDPRRAEAIKQLDAIPGQLTGYELFKILSSDEVMQGYCTLETTIIDAQIGEFDSTFWWTQQYHELLNFGRGILLTYNG